MKECDILGVSKHILTPPTYFHGGQDPLTPMIYASEVLDDMVINVQYRLKQWSSLRLCGLALLLLVIRLCTGQAHTPHCMNLSSRWCRVHQFGENHRFVYCCQRLLVHAVRGENCNGVHHLCTFSNDVTYMFTNWEMILIYVPRAVSGNIAGRSHPGVCVCRGKINIIPAILLDSVSAYSAGPTVLRALILCECCMPELQCACHLRTCAFDFLQ